MVYGSGGFTELILAMESAPWLGTVIDPINPFLLGEALGTKTFPS